MGINVFTSDFERILDTKKLDIPYFQRTFSWEEQEIRKFFEDIKELDNSNKQRRVKNIFLGSILMANGRYQGIRETKVLDGQQRLTTMILFGLALMKKGYSYYDEIVSQNPEQIDNTLQEVPLGTQDNFLTVNELKMDLDGFMRLFFKINTDSNGNNFILSPAASDRAQWNEIFKEDFIEDFISNETSYQLVSYEDALDELNTRKLAGAWRLIIDIVEEYFSSGTSREQTNPVNIPPKLKKVKRLFNLIMKNFTLSLIEVDAEEDDIEEIFTRLNSEGMELSALDHIRTFIWKGLERGNEKALLQRFKDFEKKFTAPFENMDDQPAKVGKKISSHIKNFWFPYGKTFTQLKGNGKRQAKDLDAAWSLKFTETRGLVRSTEILKHMNFYVEIYNLVTQNYKEPNSALVKEHTELVKKLVNMQYWDPASACFPYIFEASKFYINEANDEQKKDIEKSFDIIESFIMRRYFTETGETIKETLHNLYRKVEDYDFDFKVVRRFLEDERIKFLSDENIHEKFKTKKYSNASKGMRYLLMKYEVKNSSTLNDKEAKFKIFNGPNKFDVDHFMPKNAAKWETHLKENDWDLFNRDENGEEKFDKDKYEKECGNIGNLMLLSQSANRQKKDKDFDESKEIVNGELLVETKEFVNKLDSWKKQNMEERQNDLVEFFIKEWPFFEEEKKYGEDRESEKKQSEDSAGAIFSAEIREKMSKLSESFLMEYKFERIYQRMQDDLVNLTKRKRLLADINVTTVNFNIWHGSSVLSAEFRAKKESGIYKWRGTEDLYNQFADGDRLCWFWENYDDVNLNVIGIEDELAWQELLDHISSEDNE